MKIICLSAILTIMFGVAVSKVSAQKPELVVQTGSFNTVLCGAFTPDGKVFASGDADGKVILWDVATGKQFQTINAGGYISSLVFREAGKSLVTAQSHHISGIDYKSEISIWETASGKRLSSFTPSAERADVVLSNDGLLAASFGGFDETIKLWDIATGKQLKTLGETSSDPLNAALISAVAFSPDGTTLAVVSNKDIKLWDTKTGALKRSFKTASDLLEVNDLIALSPDGKHFARTAPNDAVGIRNAVTGTQSKILKGNGKLKTLTFTPDGAQLTTVYEIKNDSGTTEEREIKLWNVQTGKEIITIKPVGEEEIETVVVSPDGGLLVAVGRSRQGRQIQRFDTATGQDISRHEGRR